MLWSPLFTRGHEVGDADARLYAGIWLGLRVASDEDIIGTLGGVVRAGTVKSLSPDHQMGCTDVEGDDRSTKGTTSRHCRYQMSGNARECSRR